MVNKRTVLAYVLCLPVMAGPVWAQAIDGKTAAQYFAEAKAASNADGGKLWGTALYGPMLFVDPQSRFLVANQADAQGLLSKEGEVWTGKLPADVTMANTAKVWAGVEWTMILWPALGGDKVPRTRLMAHELFHRIQDDLNLPAANPANAHLDGRDGRVWLQLEWRALAAALRADSEQQKSAIEDALTFRLFRRTFCAAAAVEENTLEINEGLAEYTGVKLDGRPEAKQRTYAARRCEEHAKMFPSLTRSFAYTSGPAYGLLLDLHDPNWRTSLSKDSDLGEMLRKAAAVSTPGELSNAAHQRAERYDGKRLMAEEDQREANRRKLLAEYQARFIDGPTLTMPAGPNFNYSYDPNTVQAMEGVGLVYPTLSVTDDWGRLEVSNSALMIRENDVPVRLILSAPAGATPEIRESKDWKLTLHPGWRVAPDKRGGSFQVEKSDQ